MMCPRTKVLLLLMVGVLAITFDNVWSLLVLCSFSMAAMLRSGIRLDWAGKGFAVVFAIVWTTVFSQAIFYGEQPRTPLFSLGPIVFWIEGVEHGLIQSLRLVATSLAGLSLTMSTSPDRILRALQQLKFPPGVCFLAITALRFIPSLAKEVIDVRTARAHRGRPIWNRSPWAWLQMEVKLLRPIMARTLRRARTLAESLDARGYDPSKVRFSGQALHFGLTDIAAISVCGTTTLVLVAARLSFLLYAWDIAYVPALRSVYGWVRLWV